MALTKIDDRGLKTPIDLLDNEKIRFGTGNDLEIYHNGTNSYIDNNTGSLVIQSDGSVVLETTDGENYVKGTANGSVELYYDDSKKFETTSTGIKSGSVYVANSRLLIGTDSNTGHFNWSSNLQIAGTNAQAGISIRRDTNNTGGANIVIGKSRGSLNENTIVQDGDTLGQIYFAGADGSASRTAASIVGQVDGTPGSSDMPGRIVFKTTPDGSASAAERLRITSAGDVNIPNDSAKLQLGASQDLQIYHDGTNSFIENNTGQLRITSELEVIGGEGENAYIYLTADEGDDVGDKWRLRVTPTGGNYYVQNYNGTSWETSIQAIADGAVKLYHNDEQVFETNSSGVKVSNPNGEGTITIEGGEGAQAALYLYADQADDNDDKFRIRSANGGNFWLEYYNGSAWEDSLKAVADAGVALYYNNSPKFETVSSGAEIVKQLVLYSNTDKDEGEIKLNARNSSEDDDYVWIGCRNSNTSAYNWQVAGNANVFAAGSHMIGRMRDNAASPTDTYKNTDFLRFQSYQGIDDGTAYKARCLMGTANSDWDDRRIFYYADSQSDTTACDYDQDQTVSISGSGRANFKSAVWIGRVESDEGGPNSIYNSGEIGLIAYSASTNNQTNCYARNVADASSTYYVKIDNSARFLVEADGTCKADNTTNLSDADYAECFEWTDGNTSSQERRGMTVVLDGEKIKLATDSDNKDNIIGVVSPHPAVLGDSASLGWHGRYKTDVYGSTIKKEYEWLIWKKEYHYEDGVKVLCEQPDPNKPQTLDDVERVKVEDIEKEKAKNLIPDFAITNNIRYKSYANQIDTENYDTSKPYIPRKDRNEWDAIGMVGKLIVRRGQPVGTRWLLMKENIGTDTDGTVLDRYLVR